MFPSLKKINNDTTDLPIMYKHEAKGTTKIKIFIKSTFYLDLHEITRH